MKEEEENDDPSDEYIHAFNAGYQMSKYEPKLLKMLLTSDQTPRSNDFLKAMEDGKDQHEQELLIFQMKQNKDRQQKRARIKR